MMKYLVTVAVLPVMLISTNAQSPKPPRLDLDAIEGSGIIDYGHYRGWDFEDYALLISTGAIQHLPPPGATAIISPLVAGSILRINLSFTPINQTTAEANYRREFQLGCSLWNDFSSISYRDTTWINTDTCIGAFHFYHLNLWYVTGDFSYLFKTNPGKNIVLFGGVSAGGGYTVSSSFRETYFTGVSTDSCRTFTFSGDDGFSKTSTGKKALLLYASLPAGIEFRVLKKFRFMVESSLGISDQVFSKAPDALRFKFGVGAGLKYYW